MSRRVTLPGADELFGVRNDDSTVPAQATAGTDGAPRRSSGRVRHDEKITVYVTPDELLDLEHTRLLLRRDHGLAVDRGRLIREAVWLALEDTAERGPDSALVQRLLER